KRTLPFFDRCIAGDLRQGKNVLVVAHGNSNRSIVMQLDRLSGEQVVALELATGAPLVYEMEKDGATVKSTRILGLRRWIRPGTRWRAEPISSTGANTGKRTRSGRISGSPSRTIPSCSSRGSSRWPRQGTRRSPRTSRAAA